MTPELLAYLLLKSAGAAIGVAIGAFIGFAIKARKGSTDGLVRGSVTLTAMVAGLLALVAMMFFTWLRMPG